MARCNELCTKDATGTCALWEALAERDRFLWFWFQGGLFVEGVHALQRRGVFALLCRYVLAFSWLFLVGLHLCFVWFILPFEFWREIRACNGNVCGEPKRQNSHESLLDLTCLVAATAPKAPMY